MTTQSNTHFPGFDGLRLLAASSVIFSHAFLISTGTEDDEPFVKLLGPDNIVGLYGVFTFFIISGFLLAQSLSRNPNAVQFAINRTLRIYPGFIFCVLITALLLGPMGSSLKWEQYITDDQTFSYITTGFSCLCDTTLPGVFAYSSKTEHLANVVNGSLWSLSFEVLSYLLLMCFWVAFRNVKIVGAALGALAVATLVYPFVAKSIINVSYTLPYFAGGFFMYTVYCKFGLKPRAAIFCLIGLVLSSFFGWQHYTYAIFGAYLVVFIGNKPNMLSKFAERVGDVSYGMYLFGWPVEQLVKQQTQTDSPLELMVLTFPLVFLFAAISYHFVERPALRLKKPISQFIEKILSFRSFNEEYLVKRMTLIVFLAAVPTVLLSGERSWYVTRSLAEVVFYSWVGAILALTLVTARSTWRKYS